MFRWGVLGSGFASRKFVLGLKALTESTVSVVASRSPDNARQFARDFGVPNVAADYAAAARSADVDALYIATPPVAHEEHALLGIAAGKPVLIEKPFAMDAPAAERIVAAARNAGVYCQEAMWTRYLPLLTMIQSRIASGEIGEITSFSGAFMAAEQPDPENGLFNPALGGGALMDRAVYPISLSRMLLGPVDHVSAALRMGATGVDEDCALVMQHRSGALSTVQASLRTIGTSDFTVHGTKGIIRCEAPIYRPFAARIIMFQPRKGGARSGGRLEGLRESNLAQGLQQRGNFLVRALRGNPGKRITAYFRGNGYHYEAEALIRAVSRGALESDIMPLDQSVDVMRVIDLARGRSGS